MFLRSENFSIADVLGIGGPRVLVSENNTAPIKDDYCLTAHVLEFVSSNSSLDNFVASLDSQGGMLHALFNVSGPHGLPGDDMLWLSIEDTNHKGMTAANSQALKGRPADPPHEGLVEFAVKLRLPPGDYKLTFEVIDTDVTPQVNVSLHVAHCPRGSITASSGDSCGRCVRGYFSFDPQDKESTMCVANAVCPGGADLWPAQGFWHSTPQSNHMHRCINPSACLGNVSLAAAYMSNTNISQAEYRTAQCAPGYEGNLCGDCQVGYGKSRPFQCRKCMNNITIVVLYTAAALAMVGLIKLKMFFQHTMDMDRKSLQEPTSDELLKVLVLHGQWLSMISNLINIPWPETLAYPLQVINGIWSSSNGSSIGFECIVPRNSIPLAIQKVLFCLFTPAGIMCVVLLGEAIWHRFGPINTKLKQHTDPQHTRHHLVSMLMAVVFLFLPTWIGTAFSLFTCIQLDREPIMPPYQAAALGSWWVMDVGVQCYTGYHKAWAFGLGIPLLLLLCVLLPGGVFAFMWVSRKCGKLNADSSFERHYGFLYRFWRTEVCWWEAVVVLQTIGLVMVSTFGFALGGYYQGLVTSAVLGLIVVLLLWVRPYKCHAANQIVVLSACALLFTSYSALTFLPYNGLSPGRVYSSLMGVVLMLTNVGFLAYTTWRLVCSVEWSAAKNALHRVMEKGCGGRRNNLLPRGPHGGMAGAARGGSPWPPVESLSKDTSGVYVKA